jgi:hypothetical protein
MISPLLDATTAFTPNGTHAIKIGRASVAIRGELKLPGDVMNIVGWRW